MTMWSIGNGRGCCVKSKTGISLIEVLVSVSILAVGIVTVYRPLLSSVSALGYANDRMEASVLLDQQLWDLQNGILQKKRDFQIRRETETLLGKRRTYLCSRSSESLTNDNRLQKVDFQISWRDGGTVKNLRREIYLTIPYEKK